MKKSIMSGLIAAAAAIMLWASPILIVLIEKVADLAQRT